MGPQDQRKHEVSFSVLIFMFASLAAVATWIAFQIDVSLIDDVWCAVTVRIGEGGVPYFLRHTFIDSDLYRFHWLWDLEQTVRWILLGDHPGRHHLIMLSYRLLTCVAAVWVSLMITTTRSWVIMLAPAAYGFFMPIVPESRLGAQEPLFSLFLLISLGFVCRVITNYRGDLAKLSGWEKTGLVISFLCLSGTKETALVALALLTAVLLICQLEQRRAAFGLSTLLIAITVFVAWRVYVVATFNAYAAGSANLGSFNLGWLAWRLRQTVGLLTAVPSSELWLTVLLLGIFAMSGLTMVRSLRRIRDCPSGRALLVVVVLLVTLILVSAQLRYVIRYAEPAMWTAAVMFGVGLCEITRRLPHRCQSAFAILVMLLVCLGNYSAFLLPFASQQTERRMEQEAIASLLAAHEASPDRNLYIFGASPDHDWDPVRRIESATLMQSYLKHYRPLYQDRPAVTLASIEQMPVRIEPGTVIVARSDFETVARELDREIPVQLVSEHGLRHDSKIVQLYEGVAASARLLGLSAGMESAWTDAGAPPKLTDPSVAWRVWVVTPQRSIPATRDARRSDP